MEQHLGNATSSGTFFHQLSDLWKSPRGAVIRIQALAMVAIVWTFFLAAFGSCRRWSNHWFFQKGFLVATGLSLSVGTYCIGLMQTSSVKSEMYPIWCVSLFTLFGCVDSATSYSLDHKGPLWKMIFQLFLYCGYVLLISFSTISSNVGRIAIGMLSAITFVKGFHRSLALVLPSRLREKMSVLIHTRERDFFRVFFNEPERRCMYQVDWSLDKEAGNDPMIRFSDIWDCMKTAQVSDFATYRDVCFSIALSFMMQARFFGQMKDYGLRSLKEVDLGWLLATRDGTIGYEWGFKVIELELAFLYDLFFTSNAFVHYYQARAATIWSFASVIGICFVGVAAAIPGTWRTSPSTNGGGGGSGDTIVVDTTVADLTVTLVILSSLACLQVLQLLFSWSSNWSRVALACDYVRAKRRSSCGDDPVRPNRRMKVKAFLQRRVNNLFERYSWQNKLGQYSLMDSVSVRRREPRGPCVTAGTRIESTLWKKPKKSCARLLEVLGFKYVERALQELWSSGTGAAVELHPDVKEAIAGFLSKLRPGASSVRNWQSLLEANGVHDYFLEKGVRDYVCLRLEINAADPYSILKWHIATWYCEECGSSRGGGGDGGSSSSVEKNHRVATTLSRYCAYLCVSAPDLLPGDNSRGLGMYRAAARSASRHLYGKDTLEAMERAPSMRVAHWSLREGVSLGKELEEKMSVTERWEALAKVWVTMLVYAAPSNKMEVHIRHLAQGGELISHVWALLTHAGITGWPDDLFQRDTSDEEPEDDISHEDTTDEREEDDDEATV
ncbi:uncharacterized protein LOC112881359 [Panicum hallii]|jgi:hypothetical protein|nr:uncharacterized protein LOC112881359 [Panicum hallii]